MLKKSPFSPAQPWRAETRLFPGVVLPLESILNGDPAASPTRRRAQTWCSLFVAPCAPEGTPPVLTRCGLAGRPF